MKTLDTEVLIIGAGPGGLSAAIKLSKAGLKTTLIDQKTSIGEPIKCGEGEWEKDLLESGVPYKNFVTNKIKHTKIFFPEDVNITTDNENYLIIDRDGWEKNLAKIAANNGCDVFASTPAKDLIFEKDIVKSVNATLVKENIIFRPKFVILADGRFSIIRNYKERMKIDWKNYESYIFAAEYWMVNIRQLQKDTRELYMDKSITQTFYAWVFPKTSDEANIGVGVAMKENPLDVLNNFLINKKKLDVKNIIRTTIIPIPVSFPLASHNFGNVLLVGDAGRLNDAVSGGGIERALISGGKAAETIIENYENGAPLTNYETKLEPLIKKLKISYQLRRKFLGFTQENLLSLGKRWRDSPPSSSKNITLREILASA